MKPKLELNKFFSKMADPTLWVKAIKMQKTKFLPEINYLGYFCITDYESKVRIKKIFFPRWRIQNGGLQIEDKSTKNTKNEIFT